MNTTGHLRRCFYCGRAIVVVVRGESGDLIDSARCAECVATHEGDNRWIAMAREHDAANAAALERMSAQQLEWEHERLISGEDDDLYRNGPTE